MMTRFSLGAAHELGLMLTLSTAMTTVLLGGEFPPWMWLSLLVPLLSMRLRLRDVVVPPIAGTLLGVFALGAGAFLIAQQGMDAAVFAGGVTIMGLTIARSLTRATTAHDQQAILLSLILVLSGSVLNVGVSYLPGFIVYAIAAVWAMATRQLLAGAEKSGASLSRVRERDDVITPAFFLATAGVSLSVLVATAVVFATFPRVGFGELNFLGRKESQLPSSVDLGGDPRGLNTSTTPIARVRDVDDETFLDGLYLRGAIYDEITLERFSQSAPLPPEVEDQRPMVMSLARTGPERTYEVTVMPAAGSLIMTLGAATAVLAQQGGASNPNRMTVIGGRDRFDQLRTHAPIASPFRYRVRGRISTVSVVPEPSSRVPALSDSDRVRYLRVDDNDAAVRALLDSWLTTDDASASEKATRLRERLLRDYAYSLDGDVTGRAQPLRAFLLDVKRGHCELFAGSFALLLRMSGVPARVVGGFQGGAQDADGNIVFQMRHAHAWVEWWQEDTGWITDDATPQATAPRERMGPVDALLERLRTLWDDRVRDYAIEDQQSALRSITRALRGHHLGTIAKGGAGVVVVVVIVVFIARRLRARAHTRRAGDLLARAIIAAVERTTKSTVPMSDTVREAVMRAPSDDSRLHEALALYERVRYGEDDVDATTIAAVIARLRS